MTSSSEKNIDLRALRQKLGLRQYEFWTRLGVTQSGGSRYESGRGMPKATAALLKLFYIEQVPVEKITTDGFLITQYLKSQDPERYKELKKAAREWQKSQRK